MSEFNLSYPTRDNQQESKVIKSGEILFLIGANGKGKSTLMHLFSNQNQGHVRRITAHRQIWLNSNVLDLTPAGKAQNEQSILTSDQYDTARWRDDYATQRSQITIFDLIDAENVDARAIAGAFRADDLVTAKLLSNSQSPLAKMNDILKVANLDIQIQMDQGSSLLAIRENHPPYSIAELSDGERNALLIIANVLTAPANTLILIDEPERHLHRSIVSPLLSTLLTYREDCAFVISTHDVSLPLEQFKSTALLVRSYNHAPRYWVIDYIPAVEKMDEETSETILGSRRKILFIEGRKSSLDLQIYQILYPDISIRSVGSCVEIERIVKGLNASENEHWISAIGIIDRDNRVDSDCNELIQSGVIPISQYSVESIYYHPVVFYCVLERVAHIHDFNIEETISILNDSIINTFEPHIDRMAARMVERIARDQLFRQAPNWQSILNGSCQISFSTNELLDEEKENINSLIAKQDVVGLISRYPIRETPVLECIAKSLGFQSQVKYEQAVRKMLADNNNEARKKVLDILKPVTDYIHSLERLKP